jgi:phosphatidylinositol glycan class Z
MGASGSELLEKLGQAVPKCGRAGRAYQKRPAAATDRDGMVKTSHDSPTLLVAPKSATFLDQYIANSTTDRIKDGNSSNRQFLRLHELWSYTRHLGLDDMDFGDDGVWATLKRVVGRRGLGVWLVSRRCA